MIKLTMTALIRSISPVIEIPSKNGGQPYQKREMVLEDTWGRNGERYSDLVMVEFSGERMSVLDGFVVGQCVDLEAKVTGRESNGRVFNSIKGLSVVLHQSRQRVGGQRPATAQPQPQAPQQPYQQPQQVSQQVSQQPQYPSPGGYAQQPQYQQPQQVYQQPQQPPRPQGNGGLPL